MLPRLRQWSQSSSVNTVSNWFRNFPFNTESTPSQCLAPSVSRSSWSWCLNIFVTHLEIRVSNESLLHFKHPGIIVQILSSLENSFFTWMDFAFRCIDAGLLLPPLLLFEEARATNIVEATVSRCMLEASTFVLTLFESCEPCPWCTTAGFEDSTHTSLKLSSFARNKNCSSRCQSYGDEFHSQIFRDHDSWKSIRSILVNSVMVLALQYQEHQ